MIIMIARIEVMIKIKFDFGNGMINKKNVKKQILIDSFNFNNMNNKL